MRSLKGKTLFITGASRGIGRAIALRAAADGANIAIASKTDEPNPKLPGTIHTVADEIVAAGGRALPIAMDVRREEEIEAAVAKTANTFGGIDILVNNASALFLAKTPATPMKRFDMMFSVNVRGTFATTQAAHRYLAKAENPHVLVLSPPLNLVPSWFADHCAYTMSKYGMSMCVLGMSEEFRPERIAVNALWPRTMIETAASRIIGVESEGCRKPEIMADAAHAVLTRAIAPPARATSSSTTPCSQPKASTISNGTPPSRDQPSSRTCSWRESALRGGGFCVEVPEATEHRTEQIVDQGLAERQGRRLVFSHNLIDTLRRREVEAPGEKLAAEIL